VCLQETHHITRDSPQSKRAREPVPRERKPADWKCVHARWYHGTHTPPPSLFEVISRDRLTLPQRYRQGRKDDGALKGSFSKRVVPAKEREGMAAEGKKISPRVVSFQAHSSPRRAFSLPWAAAPALPRIVAPFVPVSHRHIRRGGSLAVQVKPRRTRRKHSKAEPASTRSWVRAIGRSSGTAWARPLSGSGP